MTLTWQARVGFKAVAAIAIALAGMSVDANAFPYSDFFQAANPERFGLTIFTAGFGSENKYGASHEGLEFEQSLTPYIGAVGRLATYQIWQGSGFDNPIATSASGPRNFGVFEGGLSFAPIQGTSLAVLGGQDEGDSHAPRIEGDFSSWIFFHSLHPIDFSFTGSHYYQNGLTSGTIDLRTVVRSSGDLIWMAGVGGAVWDEGQEEHFKEQEGVDLGLFLRQWRTAIDVQIGYGSLHCYGEVGISRHFGWDE
jgi:hypothetical protein